MTVQLSRSVNKRSGYQQNFIQDKSTIGSVAGDYSAATVGRFTRGRIDQVFAVSREKHERLLGSPVSLTVSATGEAQVQAYESLRYGAQQMIVSRLVADDAVNKILIAKSSKLDVSGTGPAVWSTGLESAGLPAGSLIAFKHLECFNDGLICEINAEAAESAGVPAASKIITVQFLDPVSNAVIIGPFTGSLDPLAKDEYNNSSYIADVIEQATDVLKVIDVAKDATVAVDSQFYGKANNKPKFASGKMFYFSEGRTVYTNAEMSAAIDRLRRSRPNFTYLGAGGSENVALLGLLADLGKEINKQFIFDVPGRLAPAAAVAFVQSIGASVKSMYCQAYWAPLKRINPIAGGKAFFGTSGQQIGLRCARNAQINGQGIAPRNYPIAGSDYGLSGTSITQTYTPDDNELELLAENQINPVIFKDYASGGKFAWVDSLTGAQTTGGTKLIAVTEMATFLDDKVAALGQESLQRPMADAIDMMRRNLANLLKAMSSAKWMTPSAELDGGYYQADVLRNALAPNDEMDVLYDVSWDGTNRVTRGSQTIVRAG
ncbi:MULTISPECIES: hypothetical protein [Pseudomonas]|uniref:hypothetical protein n=1 Tax=Pseudomonas TaxID=286 RepID=UPI003A8C1BCB